MTNSRGDAEWVDGVRDRADRVGWALPPQPARVAARSLPTLDPAPLLDEAQFSELPVDIRGAATSVAEEKQILSVGSAEAELSLSVSPPTDALHWEIEGRIWLEAETDALIELYWVHDDHVIATRAVRDGETFQFDEFMPADWRLDVRLPSGGCLRARDPFA